MKIRREDVKNVRGRMVERVTVEWPSSTYHAEFDHSDKADAFVMGVELANAQMLRFLGASNLT